MTSKRKTPRISSDVSVDYTFMSEVGIDHRFQNLGLGGACIQTASVQPVGTPVVLMVRLKDNGEETVLEIDGEVVWSNTDPPCDMGIRFIDVPDDIREQLKRHISSSAGDDA